MKISYIISHGVGDFVKIEKDGGDDITLKLEPKYSGTLKIGAALYEVKRAKQGYPQPRSKAENTARSWNVRRA